jgi:hypothetical protein
LAVHRHAHSVTLQVHKGIPPKQWLTDFELFLVSIPPYYLEACVSSRSTSWLSTCQPLRVALRRLGPGTANLVPDNFEAAHKLNYLPWLGKMKAGAKVLFLGVCNRLDGTPGRG